tara:strand:- start:43447 stop:44673 length:1227 start_codon:yes stop_codon:yes gene_type:complete
MVGVILEMATNRIVVQGSLGEQELKLDEWRFRFRAFRLFVCLEVLFIGFPYLSTLETLNYFFEQGVNYYFSLSMVFLVFPFAIFMKSKVRPRITITDFGVEFPRFFFWVRKVGSESISTLEEMKINENEFGVLVGLRTGSIIHVGVSDFKIAEDYRRFKNSVSSMIELNRDNLDRKLLSIRPIDWAQNVLLLLVLGLWLIVFLQLKYFSQVDFHGALDVGALTKNALSGEQYYRIAASFFLHLNNFHISMNILSLALFGQFLLRVVDLYRFICILLLSAFLASLFTLALSPYDAIIGASGGIMGVFGAYCCLRLLRYLPGSISSSSNAWILFFIAVQVALEYFVEGIDSYTHAGGFVTGFVYMWFCIKNEKEHSVFESSVYEKVAACGLALCYLGGLLLFFSKLYAAV